MTRRPSATTVSVVAALSLGVAAALAIAHTLRAVDESDGATELDSWRRREAAASSSARPLEWVSAGAGSLEINRTEITVGHYRSCSTCAAPERGSYCPSLEGPPNFPIACVSAADAENFCRSIGGRLPSIEEWAAAASLGGRARHPWGDEPPTCDRVVAVIDRSEACRSVGPVEVCSRPRGDTRWHACDLLGNVSEWTKDQEAFIAAGGSWGHTSTTAFALDARDRTDGEYRADSIGFRCARGALTSP